MKFGALHPLSWIWVCLILPCIGAASSSAQVSEERIEGKESAELSRKILLVHYMPWFESKAVRGVWGKHWTGNRGQFNPEKLDEKGLPKLASHYHPLLGPYDSSDPDLIECHLLQMKLAGIDGVIVDWYGISQGSDYPAIHLATSSIFVGAVKYGMQFAVCYEDRTIKHLVDSGELKQDQVDDQLTKTFQWLDDRWFASPNYVRVADQPLLLNFGPIFVSSAGDWQTAFASLKNRPRFFALNHLWKDVQADGGFTWVYPQIWADSPAAKIAEQRLAAEYNSVTPIATETIVSAFPGFNDRYDNGYPDINHRQGETLRETLTVCMTGEWPIVQLVTWNDFGEGTMIEPSHEFGYKFLEIVQSVRRAELGEQFHKTASSLRLPEKLYRLRKSANAREKSMDEAAELLADGETDAARLLIEHISATSSANDKTSSENGHRSFVRPSFEGSHSIQLASNAVGEGSRY
jgi:hypothetical protein